MITVKIESEIYYRCPFCSRISLKKKFILSHAKKCMDSVPFNMKVKSMIDKLNQTIKTKDDEITKLKFDNQQSLINSIGQLINADSRKTETLSDCLSLIINGRSIR